MPITPPMPPTTPPVVVTQPSTQTQDQTQTQSQDQDNTTNIGKLDQNQNTKSDADSSADSTSTQSSSLQNIQVNSNSNRIEFGSFRIPETTVTLNGTVSSNGSDSPSYSAIVGLNVPLGGGVRKDVRKALQVQVAADQLAFERTYASVCANLESEDYTVDNRATTLAMLKNCRSELISRKTPKPPAPPVVVTPPTVNHSSELEQLKKDNAELRILLAQLAAKLDKQNSPVPGGY